MKQSCSMDEVSVLATILKDGVVPDAIWDVFGAVLAMGDDDDEQQQDVEKVMDAVAQEMSAREMVMLAKHAWIAKVSGALHAKRNLLRFLHKAVEKSFRIDTEKRRMQVVEDVDKFLLFVFNGFENDMRPFSLEEGRMLAFIYLIFLKHNVERDMALARLFQIFAHIVQHLELGILEDIVLDVVEFLQDSSSSSSTINILFELYAAQVRYDNEAISQVWPLDGLACFLYLVLTLPSTCEQHQQLSVETELVTYLPALECLLKRRDSQIVADRGLELVHLILKDRNDLVQKHNMFEGLGTLLLDYALSHPEPMARRAALNILNQEFLPLFDADATFDLLSALYKRCPHPTGKALLIDHLRSDVSKALSMQPSPPTYVTKHRLVEFCVWQVLNEMTDEQEIDQYLDPAAAIISLLHFLKLRDEQTNVTGISQEQYTINTRLTTLKKQVTSFITTQNQVMEDLRLELELEEADKLISLRPAMDQESYKQQTTKLPPQSKLEPFQQPKQASDHTAVVELTQKHLMRAQLLLHSIETAMMNNQ